MKKCCETCNSFRKIEWDDRFSKDHNKPGFEKLNPCPFCGKRSIAFLSCHTSATRGAGGLITKYHGAVHCFECGCSGPTVWHDDRDMAAYEAATAWNKRWEHPSKKKRKRVPRKITASTAKKALYATTGYTEAPSKVTGKVVLGH